MRIEIFNNIRETFFISISSLRSHLTDSLLLIIMIWFCSSVFWFPSPLEIQKRIRPRLVTYKQTENYAPLQFWACSAKMTTKSAAFFCALCAMSEFYITNLEESFYSLITLCEMTATKSKAFYFTFFFFYSRAMEQSWRIPLNLATLKSLPLFELVEI